MTKLIPAGQINISAPRYRGKQRRISCLVSVKLQEAVRMVQNCKRRSREWRDSPLLDDYLFPERAPTPAQLSLRSRRSFNSRIQACPYARTLRSEFRNGVYAPLVILDTSWIQIAIALMQMRHAVRRNQTLLALNRDYRKYEYLKPIRNFRIEISIGPLTHFRN